MMEQTEKKQSELFRDLCRENLQTYKKDALKTHSVYTRMKADFWENVVLPHAEEYLYKEEHRWEAMQVTKWELFQEYSKKGMLDCYPDILNVFEAMNLIKEEPKPTIETHDENRKGDNVISPFA